MPSLPEENKIIRHNNLLKYPINREMLIKTFAPTWFYHGSEVNFPDDPEEALKNIVIAKRDEYLRIKQEKKRDLTPTEQEDLDLIDCFFWKDNQFNENYYQKYLENQNYKNYKDYRPFESLRNSMNKDKNASHFLVFDEKHYGYKVGQKINVDGVSPHGYKNFEANKPSAPLFASIIPTKEGFYINYQFVYTLNNAIRGTQWLRRKLPARICNIFDNFGFHYGDCEGVGIHVRCDDEGHLELTGMQTFAHGSKGAQYVPIAKCDLDENGHVCVYVGVGGHPSYAKNFVGRNRYFDLVGAKYPIRPNQFVEVSPDLCEKAFEEDAPVEQKQALFDASSQVPRSLLMFRRFADSNPLTYSGPKNQADVDSLARTHNNYHPWHFFSTLSNIRRSLSRCFTRTPRQPVRQAATCTLHAVDDQSVFQVERLSTKEKRRTSIVDEKSGIFLTNSRRSNFDFFKQHNQEPVPASCEEEQKISP